MRHRSAASAAILGLSFWMGASSAAPLSYTGGAYTQNFDGLPTNVTNPSQVVPGKGPHEFSVVSGASGLVGWQFANPSGSSSNTEFRSHNGSLSGSAGRGVISFGDNGSSERALGALATSNQISSFGLVLTNDTGLTLDSFTLSYTGEQWRRGNVANPNTLFFSYAVGGTSIGSGTFTGIAALNFVAPNTQVSPTDVALDGNNAANQTFLSGGVATGLGWAPGDTLVLRWLAQDLSGQDDGLGIDNLTFSAAAIPEASTLCLVGASAATLSLGLLRRRK